MKLEGKKILVVDDEPDMAYYLTALLEEQGARCTVAANGIEGLESVRRSPPDLVCLDLSMPERTGIKMFREMRRDPATSGIPVVIVTGLTRDFEFFLSRRRLVAAPEGFVSKPIDVQEFLAKVAGAVAAGA